ncbi:hypothetical protein [Flagellimonas crocea]|uniref:hypothetical protein n=1 Tax=Flagellimonas crocea TaxID=3067311 RepID=UPI00296ECEB5|nr:hypothetical protein [Muricauda sp. DH64]
MDKKILFKAKSETLTLIKNEAEKNLKSIQNAEDVITNKSNTLMQILLPIFIILSGFCINSYTSGNYNTLFYITVCFLITLGVVIFRLHKNVLPIKSAMEGCEPNQLLQSDMISGNHKIDERNILINRIYNLQKAIEYSLKSHTIRYQRYSGTNKILLLSLISLIILFVLYQIFLLFQDMCLCP